MSWLDSLTSALQGQGQQGGLGGMGGQMFPMDPGMSAPNPGGSPPLVDPAYAQQARKNAILQLGLGLMAARDNRQGLGAGLSNAFQGAQQNYQGAMDSAFRNTMMRREADYQQQERAIQIKQQQRTEREQASQTAQRVSAGMASAPDKAAYWNLIGNSPEVKDMMTSLAIKAPGSTGLVDPNDQQAFMQQLQGAGGIGAPAQQPIKLSQGDVLVAPGDYHTLASAAPKSTVEYKDAGDKLIPVNNVTGQVVQGLPSIPKTKTPDQEAGAFTPSMQSLLGAMAQAGVSLPAGLRSQKQQVATLQGLLDANPGVAPADIVNKIRTGQLDFNGAKRSTSQLATVAAAADAQSRQLEKNFAALEPLVGKMDKMGIPVINRAFAQLRQNWQVGGDKDTAAFLTYLRAVAGEYAKLKSGGTGAAAPAEGEMKDALQLMTNAFSTGGYQGMKEAMLTEAANKRSSYSEGLKAAAIPGASVGGATTATPSYSSAPSGWSISPVK